MEHFKIFYPLLSGFREKSSTMHALISVTEYIHRSIDNNEVGCGIFIDLKKKKGCKTVKLNHYEIRGNVHEWCKSYLSHREQFVIVNGHVLISLT